jgi:hypothetical protein
MSDLRAAALQALEFCELLVWHDVAMTEYVEEQRERVEAALRAALEAQEEPRREWQGLTDEEIIDAREQIHAEDLCNWSFSQGVIFAEQALKERNHE